MTFSILIATSLGANATLPGIEALRRIEFLERELKLIPEDFKCD